jgi:hypothetical protein
MNKIKSYRGLIVWHKAMDLVALGYNMAKTLPEIEGYCLIFPGVHFMNFRYRPDWPTGWNLSNRGHLMTFLKKAWRLKKC